MHTLSYFNFATWITPSLAAVYDSLSERLRQRRARAEARRAAQAFQHLDDRTLRDIGFYREDIGTINVEPDTLRRRALPQ